MTRVLITGGTGLIGRALVDALLEHPGFEVALLHPRRPDDVIARDPRRITYIPFALERAAAIDAAGFGRGDVLVHLAWTSHPATSMDAIPHDCAVNVAASAQVFEHAARAGVSRIVFASSGGTVYGAPQALQLTEDTSTLPISAYGVGKLSGEKYLALFSHHFGPPGISLRVGNPYGAWQLRGVPIGALASFMRSAAQSQPIQIWGDGEIVRDYIAVADVARAFVAAITAPDLAGGAYNIGSGSGTSLNQLLDLVGAVSGRKLDVRRLPARKFDVPRVVLDSDRFRRATGWKPQVDLREGAEALWRHLP